MSWQDSVADELQQKVSRFEAQYSRLDRIASRKTGETRAELLDRLVDLKNNILGLMNRIENLKSHRKI